MGKQNELTDIQKANAARKWAAVLAPDGEPRAWVDKEDNGVFEIVVHKASRACGAVAYWLGSPYRPPGVLSFKTKTAAWAALHDFLLLLKYELDGIGEHTH